MINHSAFSVLKNVLISPSEIMGDWKSYLRQGRRVRQRVENFSIALRYNQITASNPPTVSLTIPINYNTISGTFSSGVLSKTSCTAKSSESRTQAGKTFAGESQSNSRHDIHMQQNDGEAAHIDNGSLVHLASRGTRNVFR